MAQLQPLQHRHCLQRPPTLAHQHQSDADVIVAHDVTLHCATVRADDARVTVNAAAAAGGLGTEPRRRAASGDPRAVVCWLRADDVRPRRLQQQSRQLGRLPWRPALAARRRRFAFRRWPGPGLQQHRQILHDARLQQRLLWQLRRELVKSDVTTWICAQARLVKTIFSSTFFKEKYIESSFRVALPFCYILRIETTAFVSDFFLYFFAMLCFIPRPSVSFV